MSRSRLSLALEAGTVVVPETGSIAVINPARDLDLSDIESSRITVFHDFRPDHDHWIGQGYSTASELSGEFAAAIVTIPRARVAARDLVARAARMTRGPVIVDGQKTDGIDSVLKDIRARAKVGEVFSKAHGKIFSVDTGDFREWQVEPTSIKGGFMTRPGTFSSDAPDPGSVFLVETLPRSLKGTIADLGAGWGYLARHLLDHSAVTELHLVEAQKSALDCARHNVADPRVRFHWADAGAISDLPPLDVVVTNPPFHKGRKGDPSLGVAFIEASRRLLKPAGELWLVANRHLPYEKALDQAFLDVTAIAQTPGYKIFHARRPKRRRS